MGFIMADHVEENGVYPYQRQWQRMRNRRNLFAVVLVIEFLGFFPFGILVTSVERRFGLADKIFDRAMLCYGILYMLTASRLRRFPCPRYGKNFFGGFFATTETVMGRNCANCGLRRYAEE